MKVKYIGDPNNKTPEGINSGPLHFQIYGLKFEKNVTVHDIPDDTLVTNPTGQPVNPPQLVCKKLANNNHFEVVQDERRGPGRPRTKSEGA